MSDCNIVLDDNNVLSSWRGFVVLTPEDYPVTPVTRPTLVVDF